MLVIMGHNGNIIIDFHDEEGDDYNYGFDDDYDDGCNVDQQWHNGNVEDYGNFGFH